MNTRAVIKSQYQATLSMLEATIARCPDAVWFSAEPTTPYWRIAYHALFYAHLYLQPTEADFEPWAKHQDEIQFLGALPWPPHDPPKDGEPYAREDVLAYLAFCRAEVDRRTDNLDLEAESGFYWLSFGKLELQFYSIRHIQNHVGELSQRLAMAGVEIDWVGVG